MPYLRASKFFDYSESGALMSIYSDWQQRRQDADDQQQLENEGVERDRRKELRHESRLKQRNIRVTDSDWLVWVAAADLRGSTVSSLIRDLVNTGLSSDILELHDD